MSKGPYYESSSNVLTLLYIQIEISQCAYTIIHIEKFAIQCFLSTKTSKTALNGLTFLPSLPGVTDSMFSIEAAALQLVGIIKMESGRFCQELFSKALLFCLPLIFNAGMPFTELWPNQSSGNKLQSFMARMVISQVLFYQFLNNNKPNRNGSLKHVWPKRRTKSDYAWQESYL